MYRSYNKSINKSIIVLWKFLISIFLLVSFSIIEEIACQLIVNVKNQGGEVYQETISANLTDETIQLQFQQTDGSLVTQFWDFKNEIQILNRLSIGDEELQFTPYSDLCFVTRFSPSEFVAVDAMAKLRQKNPWAIRTPEKVLAKENLTMDVILDIRSSDWISPHIKQICEDSSSTFGIRNELESIFKDKVNQSSNSVNADANSLDAAAAQINEEYLRTVKQLIPSTENCYSATGKSPQRSTSGSSPCQCTLDQCIGWYPCALKYCNTTFTGNNGNTSHEKSYRCGIHTCKKCTKFYFSVSRRDSCILI